MPLKDFIKRIFLDTRKFYLKNIFILSYINYHILENIFDKESF